MPVINAYAGRTTRQTRTLARSWTGRAAMSCSTTTPIAAFVTSGTKKTRVSEMRGRDRAGSHFHRHGATGPEPATLQRRNQGNVADQPRWSG